MVKAGASDFALKRISFNRNRLFRSHTDGSNQKSYAIHRRGTVLYDSNDELKLFDVLSTDGLVSELSFRRDGSDSNFDAFKMKCREWYNKHSDNQVRRRLLRRGVPGWKPSDDMPRSKSLRERELASY